MSYVPGTSQVDAVDSFLCERDEVLRDLRSHWMRARDRMKTVADRHRRDVTFSIGDFVYLKLQPYRQTSIQFRASVKLAPRFFGPYKVLERVGAVAYRLELPLGTRIHNIFHVSQLRKHHRSLPASSFPLPPTTDDAVFIPQPESILDRRMVHKDRYRPRLEVLVKWHGMAVADATWESVWRFSKAYPDFYP